MAWDTWGPWLPMVVGTALVVLPLIVLSQMATTVSARLQRTNTKAAETWEARHRRKRPSAKTRANDLAVLEDRWSTAMGYHRTAAWMRVGIAVAVAVDVFMVTARLGSAPVVTVATILAVGVVCYLCWRLPRHPDRAYLDLLRQGTDKKERA